MAVTLPGPHSGAGEQRAAGGMARHGTAWHGTARPAAWADPGRSPTARCYRTPNQSLRPSAAAGPGAALSLLPSHADHGRALLLPGAGAADR